MRKEATPVFLLTTIIGHVVIIWLIMKSEMKSCLAEPHNNKSIITNPSSSNITVTHGDDESSLLAIKVSIIKKNPGTSLDKNWSQRTPLCNWIGVECGSLRHPFRVTALNLSYMDLEGTIPEEIGDLSFLSGIDIRNNSFTGPIPDTIGNLRRLRVLRMFNNRLTGQIPFTIGKLTKLERLTLYGNQLTGTIPTSIFNISSLNNIYLDDNRLSGNLPDDINLPNLEFLSLSRNQLTGTIPPIIYKLPSLQDLYLDGNRLTGTLPLDIDLPNLEILNLSGNNLTGTIPDSIFNLSSLNEVSLYSNQLTGTIPTTIFNLSSLQTIYLNDNRLSGNLPNDINLPNLQFLSISRNELTGTIPGGIFNLSSLQEIYLNDNRLSGDLPKDINFPNLQIVMLSRNELTGTIPGSIFNVSSLQEIYLDGNQLSGSLPGDITWRELENQLINLDLSENQLNGHMPLSSLSTFTELKTVYLYSNNFTGNIPREIRNLSQLQMFDLSRNQLTGIIPSSIGNLSNLEELDLGYNNLHGKIPSEIGHLFNLNYLSLQQNKLNGEVPLSLFNLSNLQVLSFVGNELSGELLPFISTGLPLLQELYLGENQFSGIIPNSLSNLSQLTLLDLSINKFSGLIPTNLGSLHKLQTLRFASNLFTNNLSRPDQDFLSPLTNCENLNVIGFNNNLKITGELPKAFFDSTNLSTTLEKIRAFSCGISGEIPIEVSNMRSLILLAIGENELVGAILESLGNLTNLQRITLYENMLQGPIPHNICNMKSLFHLSLSMNDLSGPLPSCLGTDLNSLREIYLSDNAFNSNIPPTLWFSGSELDVIFLDNNFFDGTLSPSIGNLKSLTELDISGNQLFGDIPDSIGQLQSLTYLSLSNNKINGSIPDSFSNLQSLEYFDLSNNSLSGRIPMSLKSLEYLTYFNVSFNELTGEIPSEGPFENFTADSFMGNNGLCGVVRFKVEECKEPSRESNHLRFILPIVVVSIFVAGVFVFFVVRYLCKKPSRTSILSSELPRGSRISYYDIRRATNNFDGGNLIGRGSFGLVYKGEFFNGLVAAVKVFNLEAHGAMSCFDTECEIMSNIRHRNLVKVITSCSNVDFKALVMEYMPNGNLEKWLYDTECSLNISQRFDIMKDVAAALEYLHHGYSTPIIHCDLKPSNILLDRDMVAHVGDFGISKLLSGEDATHQTKTLGTIGYMAPEYGSGGFISTAVDVYSYGVVVVEMFTRRKPTDEMFSGELTMKKWLSESFPDSLSHIVDLELLNTTDKIIRVRQERCLTSMIELALECITEVPEERPTSIDVMAKIERIRTGL